jgi:hypothetical protein
MLAEYIELIGYLVTILGLVFGAIKWGFRPLLKSLESLEQRTADLEKGHRTMQSTYVSHTQHDKDVNAILSGIRDLRQDTKEMVQDMHKDIKEIVNAFSERTDKLTARMDRLIEIRNSK